MVRGDHARRVVQALLERVHDHVVQRHDPELSLSSSLTVADHVVVHGFDVHLIVNKSSTI